MFKIMGMEDYENGFPLYTYIEGGISSSLMGKGIMDEQPQHSEFAIECFFLLNLKIILVLVLCTFASLWSKTLERNSIREERSLAHCIRDATRSS